MLAIALCSEMGGAVLVASSSDSSSAPATCRAVNVVPWPLIYTNDSRFNNISLPSGVRLVAAGQLVNANVANVSALSGEVAFFDLSWQSITIADDLLRVQRLNATAVILTSAFRTPPLFLLDIICVYAVRL